MTEEEKQKAINALKKSAPVKAMTSVEFEDYIQTLNKIIDWLEQPETVTEFADRCRECGKQRRCKECRWWKDSDGLYRRGVEAESICPINSKVVFDGNGYCYMFEPREKRGIRMTYCITKQYMKYIATVGLSSEVNKEIENGAKVVLIVPLLRTDNFGSYTAGYNVLFEKEAENG